MCSLPLRNGIISFKKDDDYETTEDIIKMVLPYLVEYKTIYEPFYCTGRSGDILKSFGLNVIHKEEDFFHHYKDYDYDIIFSNPPFSIKKKIFNTLREIDKPFCLVVPISTLTKQFFTEKYKGTDISILIPPRRMQFSKKGDVNGRCWFDCIFICYKMKLPKEIIYI